LFPTAIVPDRFTKPLFLIAINVAVFGCVLPYTVGTSDFDAQMSGRKFFKDDAILRLVYKKPFSEILSGCFLD
jgi:hypothetical protein